MTAKEKAKELVLKYWNLPIKMNHIIDGVIHIENQKHLYENDAKQCALIAVDEIILSLTANAVDWIRWEQTKKFWQEVKQEIENL